MHGTSLRRRIVAIFAGLAMVAGIVAAGATPASAKTPPGKNLQYQWSNAGDIEFTVTGGLISLNNGMFEVDLSDAEADPEAEPGEPITLTGTIDEAGSVHVPAAGVSFPEAEIEEGGLNLAVTIQASSDAVGLVDPKTGDASISINLQIVIVVQGLAANCTINMPMTMTSDGPGGQSYGKDGSATLSDNTFAVPNTTAGGLLGFLACPQVNTALGLPAPAGSNLTSFTMVTDPVLKSKVIPPGEFVETKSDCEGDWSNDRGTHSCAVEVYETTLEMDETGNINWSGNTSGTNRWRANIQTTVTTETEKIVTDSQQGTLGGLGTGETYEQTEDVLDEQVTLEHQIISCQQTSLFGTWQNRALDSPNCVTILNAYIASL